MKTPSIFRAFAQNSHPLSTHLSVMLLVACATTPAVAGPLRDWASQRAMERMEQRQSIQSVQRPMLAMLSERSANVLDALEPATPAVLAKGIRVIEDIPYGADRLQSMDVYLPAEKTANAPILMLVHGGAWQTGDKRNAPVIQNKVNHWVPQGMIVVSINYRLLPQTPVAEQLNDVATAMAKVQAMATGWGGDPAKVILMGHSAGAHLVSLFTANPKLAIDRQVKPWLGSIALDSAAMDIPTLMASRHLPLYDRAFGKDPAQWPLVSPLQQWQAVARPLLSVCSTLRKNSCEQAIALQTQAIQLKTPVRVLPVELSHQQINAELGQPSEYTNSVDAYIGELLLGLPIEQQVAPMPANPDAPLPAESP